MKKYVLAVVLALVAGSAIADEYVGVGVGSTRTTDVAGTSTRSNYGVVTLGQNIGQFAVEGRVAVKETATTNALGDFVEARARYNFADVVGVKPWVRVSVGEQFTGAADHAYVGVEPGVGYQFTPTLRGDVSIARAVTTAHVAGADATTGEVGVSYALTTATSVGVNYSHAINQTGTVSQLGTSAVVVSFNHSL